jgi:hypothetical protein
MGWKHRIKDISLAFLVELYSTAIHVPTVSIISTLLFACVDLPFPLFLSTLVDTVMHFVVLYCWCTCTKCEVLPRVKLHDKKLCTRTRIADRKHNWTL